MSSSSDSDSAGRMKPTRSGLSLSSPKARFRQIGRQPSFTSPRRSTKSHDFSSSDEESDEDIVSKMAFADSAQKSKLGASSSSQEAVKRADKREKELRERAEKKRRERELESEDESVDSMDMGEEQRMGGKGKKKANKGWAAQERAREAKSDDGGETEQKAASKKPRASRRSQRVATPNGKTKRKTATRTRSRSRLVDSDDDDDEEQPKKAAEKPKKAARRSRRQVDSDDDEEEQGKTEKEKEKEKEQERELTERQARREKRKEKSELRRGASSSALRRTGSYRRTTRKQLESEEESSDDDDAISSRAKARNEREQRRFDGRKKESRARMVREDLRAEAAAVGSPKSTGSKTPKRAVQEETRGNPSDEEPPQQPKQQRESKESSAEDTKRDPNAVAAAAASKESKLSDDDEEAEVETADLGAVLNIKPAEMEKFLTSPTHRKPGYGAVQCYIERKKTSMDGTNSEYYVFLKHDHRFLMAAKKKPGNKTSNYAISMSKDKVSDKGYGYLGKVRSNFVGTEYLVYDGGENPEHYRGDDQDQVRKELGCVTYASNVLGARGPRKMRVCVPQLDPATKEPVVFRPAAKSDSLLQAAKDGDGKCYFLINKPPRWNESVRAYVLNFNGRVTQASVKNFQLVHPDDHDRVILQFGRVGKKKFTMDYQYPLSPFQAFAICLSSFDYKLACE